MAARHVVAAFALVAATFAVTRAVYSQDGEKKAGGMPSEEEMMKMMVERAALTDEHKKLAEMAGNWDSVMVMTGTDGKETRTPGTMSFETKVGGHVVVSSLKGSMMGAPYEGMGLDGYDKQKKQFWSMWCDSYGNVMRFTGARDAEGNLAMKGEPADCGMGPCTMDYVIKVKDKDHVTMEAVNHMNGMDEKWSIEYTRKK